MHKKWKKTMAGMLGVCLITTCVPGISEFGGYTATNEVVQAATTKKAVSGKCGKKATWKYNTKTKTLTIGGSGVVTNYAEWYIEMDESCMPPWIAYKDELKKVVVGSKITEIGDGAFAKCTALKEVELGKNVKKVRDSAFYRCDALEKINLGDKLTTIENDAFYGCKNLKNITVGKALKSIGYKAFAGCTGLKKIKVNSKNKYFKVKDNNLLSKDGTKWILGCFVTNHTCTIDKNIKSIAMEILRHNPNVENVNVDSQNKTYCSKDGLLYSKAGKKLYFCPQGKKGTVTVWEEATAIGDGVNENAVFENCASLEKIIIGEKVSDIHVNFEGCTNLKEIEIAEGNQKYASDKGSILSKDRTELLCCVATEDGTYKIPDGVTRIEQWAFRRCLGRDGSFGDDIKIEHLILSDSLEQFSELNIYDEQEYTVPNKFEGVKSITLGEKYYDGETMPWLLKYIDKMNLEAVHVSQNNPYYSSVDGVLYNKEQTKLLLCPIKKKICNMPNTVTSIDKDAFYDSKEANGLEQLSVSDGIENIAGADWVFGWNLKTLHIGKNVKKVNVNMYAKTLEKITVSPENETYKAEDSILYTKNGKKLLYCPKAKTGTVTVCSGTSIIGEVSLLFCRSVTDIIIPDTVTSIESHAFSCINENAVFWVPVGKKEFYENLLTKETGFGKQMSIKEMQ